MRGLVRDLIRNITSIEASEDPSF